MGGGAQALYLVPSLPPDIEIEESGDRALGSTPKGEEEGVRA